MDVGIFANTIAGISLIPQVHKVIKNKKVKDMSYLWLFLSVIANILWIIYGVSNKKWQVCAMGIMFTIFYGIHFYIKHQTEENPHHPKNID